MNVQRESGYNWLGVMDFIQSEFSANQLKEKQWAFQRQFLLNKITKLEAQAKTHEIVHLDLMRRIQMLELALREERSGRKLEQKPSVELNIQSQKEDELVDAEAKRLNQSENMQFLDRILTDIGIELNNHANILRHSDGKAEKRTVYNLVSHLDSVIDIFYTPGAQCLTSVGEDCLIKFWDLSSLDNRTDVEVKISAREHTGQLYAIAGTPLNSENQLVFVGGSEGVITAWDVSQFRADYSSCNYADMLKGSWSNYVGEADETILWQLAYNQDRLATSSSDSSIKIHSLGYEYSQSKLKAVKGEIVKTFVNRDKSTGTVRNPTCLAWLNNNSIVNGYNNLDSLSTWDLNQEKLVESYRYSTELYSNTVRTQTNKIVVNSIMGLLVCAHEDNCVRAFDIASKKVVKKLQHADSVSCLAVSQRNRWCLFAGSHDGTVKVWDLRKNLCIEELSNVHLKKYDECIRSLLYIDELCSIVTAGSDGLVKIFQA